MSFHFASIDLCKLEDIQCSVPKKTRMWNIIIIYIFGLSIADYDDNISNSTSSISASQTAAERQSSAVSAATAAAAAVSQKIANAVGGGGGGNGSGSASSGSSGKNSSSHHGKHGGGSSSGGSGSGSTSANNSGGKHHGKNDAAASAGGADAGATNTKKDENGAKVHDEKRRHIKSIIDRIPTQKEELFNYKLDRNEIDSGLMERKIRPWINKKIIEYIGEPEPTLVDFICSKVLAGSPPQSILDDVQMVSIRYILYKTISNSPHFQHL